jgi:hypothetical protein
LVVTESVIFDPENEVVLTQFVHADAGPRITDLSPQFFVRDRGETWPVG